VGATLIIYIIYITGNAFLLPEVQLSIMTEDLNPKPNKIHVLSHPVVTAKLSVLRQTTTSSKEFREVSKAALFDALIDGDRSY
jgi:hypothetical protein